MKKLTAEQVIAEVHKSMDLINASLTIFPWEEKEYYAHWLAQTYYYVWRSTRFAALASALCPPDQDFFHYEFMKGVNEEKGHDMLARNDLRALGYEIEDFPELPSTASFHQTLNHLMNQESHFAILGYSTPLEGAASTFFLPVFKKVKEAYTPRSINFLRVHCEVDQRHFGEAIDLIKKVPENHLPTVLKAVRQAGYIYKSILDQIIETTVSHKQSRPQRPAPPIQPTL